MVEIAKGMLWLMLLIAGEIVLVGEMWVLRVFLDWCFEFDYVKAVHKWLTRG